MKLKQALLQCDEHSTADLEQLYAEHCSDEFFIQQLLEQLADEHIQQTVSWLIKKRLEDGKTKLSIAQSSVLLSYLNIMTAWQVRLHILQSLPYCIFAPQDKSLVEFYLRENLMDNNKFIRAWTYSGFYYLSLQFTEYKAEVNHFFQLALQDEVPSVKARIRHILKKAI